MDQTTKNPSLIRASKALSFLLRHGAEKHGIPISKDGFCLVQDLLKYPKLKDCSIEVIAEIVANDAKGRFHLERDNLQDGQWKIRANQGHSIDSVDVELEEIKDYSHIPTVIHGTYLDKWASIKSTGLSRMSRQHVHFSVGLVGERGVKSGIRPDCNLFIYINTQLAMADGIKFYRSMNNVVLSDGFDGIIPTKYFAKVMDKENNIL